MKKSILFCVFTIIAVSGFGQLKDTIVVSIDTINIRGIVYNSENKPVKNMEIGIQGARAPKYPFRTKSDTNGCFELKGIDPNGKLYFTDGKYENVAFPIHGSRFIVIYLPLPKIIAINSGDSIVVNAHRIYPKIKLSFRKAIDTDKVFPVYGQYPEYKGGPGKLISYVRQNLIYPEKAIENNIEGTVEIVFTIKRDGSRTDFKVIKGIGYGCDEEVISLLKKTPDWKPGISNNGRPYSIDATISVKFSLTDH